jgi:hypothetical protein
MMAAKGFQIVNQGEKKSANRMTGVLLAWIWTPPAHMPLDAIAYREQWLEQSQTRVSMRRGRSPQGLAKRWVE